MTTTNKEKIKIAKKLIESKTLNATVSINYVLGVLDSLEEHINN